MEFPTIKPSKTSSNISEMVSMFAKVCKFRSIGVFSNENPNHSHHHLNNNNNNNNNNNVAPSRGEDSSDATEETESNGQKIYPQPAEVTGKSNICGGNKDILHLFDIVSALKVAYVQLQEAHLPYNPDKIVAADGLVVAQLEALCKIKQMYKEKQFAKSKLESSRLDCLRAEVDVNEKLLEKLKSENRVRDAEIVCLRQELRDLELCNSELVEKARKITLQRRSARIFNASMFKDTFQKASKSIHDFAKPVISLMKATGWDLDLAANSIENGIVYSKRSHKKYAFEAYIARRMFHGMLLKSYNVDDVMRFDDPIDSLIAYPNSEFANFCRKKYLFVVHPLMEMSFFKNLDQRMFVLSGKHPRTPFYQMFARMAKWIWVLQGIATSIDPRAVIFFVNRGIEFSDAFMEAIEAIKESAIVHDGGQSKLKVEFMVMPGFKIGDTVVRSRVYL